MIFGYDELKEYVQEDFERFYNMGFDEKQMFPAVLREYEYGEDFCRAENICIHIFLALCYKKKKLNFRVIIEKLKLLLTEEACHEVRIALGNEYAKYIADIDSLKIS